MKKSILFGAVGGLLLLGGGAGVHFGKIPAPGPLHMLVAHVHTSHHPDPPPVFSPKKAVLISLPAMTANLQGGQHYLHIAVSFEVDPKGLKTAGIKKKPAAGSSGTGDPVVDDKIQQALTLLARQTSYTQLQTSAGVKQFTNAIRQQLLPIFGPGMVGPVFVPTLLTQ